MKILITGGVGYIGSILTNYLISKKAKVFIIDNFSTAHKINLNKGAKIFKGDIRNIDFVTSILIKHKIKNVIHLAAKMSNDESLKNPIKYYDNNIYGTFSLVKACNTAKVKNIVFSSSCAVYGRNKTSKISERHPLNPAAPYGLSKILSENMIYHNVNSSINFAILRYFNVIGANFKEKKGQIYKNNQLFQNIALNIVKKFKLKIYGNKFNTKDGYAVRDFIDVNDLAELHYLFLILIKNKKKKITVNCGYGKGASVKDVISKFEKITDKKVKFSLAKYRPGDIPYSVSNNNKMKKSIKWKPKFSNIEKSIRNTILWNKFLDQKGII